MKDCSVYQASKVVCHKFYADLHLLPVLMDWWKDLFIDFVIGLPISANQKSDSYNSILVIVDQLSKIVYYKPINITIDGPGLAKVIINVIMYHHGVSESIIMDRDLLFISKYCFLLYYFLGIKKKLSTAFYPQTNSQTKRQNNMIEAYLRAFVNQE